MNALKDLNSLFSLSAFTLSTRLDSSLQVTACLIMLIGDEQQEQSGNMSPLVAEYMCTEPQSMQF